MKKVTHWLILIAGIIVACSSAFWLPACSSGRASRFAHARTKQKPEAIWAAYQRHANEPAWRSDIQNVHSIGERNGKPVWQENYKDGNRSKDHYRVAARRAWGAS